MRSVWLVARREFTERARSRAYQLSTLITLLLVAALLVLPALFDSASTYTIGVSGATPDGLVAAVEQGAADPATVVEVEEIDGRDAVTAAVEDGDVDVGIIDGTTVVTGPDSPGELVTLVTGVAAAEALSRSAAELGIDQATLGELLATGPTVEEIEPDDDEELRNLLAFVATLVLFVSIVTYGQWVLQGVVEEKSSRVVEVILGAVRPRHLLAGKVVGIGALGLIQVVAIGVTGLIAVRFVDSVDLPPITLATVAVLLGWFILGFAFFASGYAVAGSLVSNTEDAQNAAFPLTLVMVAAYLIASSALGAGTETTVLRVLSIVPPFSPLVMPLRQVAGSAEPWEVALSVALMLLAIALMLRIGGRIYSGGLLRSGARAKVKDAFRGAEI